MRATSNGSELGVNYWQDNSLQAQNFAPSAYLLSIT